VGRDLGGKLEGVVEWGWELGRKVIRRMGRDVGGSATES
jgi:hypothetical protein